MLMALLLAAPAWAQPSVDALRIYLGAPGSSVTLDTSAGAARVNGDATITGDVSATDAIVSTLLATGTNAIRVEAALPVFRLTETDASADNGQWNFFANNEQLTFSARGDAGGGTSWLTVDRTGTTPDVLTFDVADILPATNYMIDLGSLSRKYLTLHAAELWVETLVAHDTMATIGGRVLVGPTTTLTSDLASGATSIGVEHNQIASGDRIVLQSDGKLEWLAVTSAASGSGPYTYSVTRNLDGTGANDWYAGDAVFNTGTTGDGYIDLYSVNGLIPGSTAGPTIVGNVRTGTTYNQIDPRWAIGNLNGLYGYGADTYGAAFGAASGAWAKIDATNGVRLGHNTTTNVSIDASGNAAFGGSIVAGGVLRSSGASALGTGTGYWLDATSTPVFRVGNPSGNRITWDGTDLTLVSERLTIDADGIRLTPETGATFLSDLTRRTASTCPTARWASSRGSMGWAVISCSNRASRPTRARVRARPA